MSLSLDEVRRLARLAALDVPSDRASLLSDAVVMELAKDIGAILDHVHALSSLDLSGVLPTSHGMPLPTRLRDDVVGERLPRERALSGAPAPIHDAFSVPKVIE